jgi:hypothetical protein
MKFSLAIFLVFASLTVAFALPVDDNYRRRKHPEKVKQQMVEYWSRPDVLPNLPATVKPEVEKYIVKFPEYHYKPPPPLLKNSSPPPEEDPHRSNIFSPDFEGFGILDGPIDLCVNIVDKCREIKEKCDNM